MELWTGASFAQAYASKKRRKRVGVSCTLCRSRKIKCDQKRPCTACTKRGCASNECTYDREEQWVLDSASAAQTIDELTRENNKLRSDIERLRKSLPLHLQKEKLCRKSNSNFDINEVEIELLSTVRVDLDCVAAFGPTAYESRSSQGYGNKGLLSSVSEYLESSRHLWCFDKEINSVERISFDSWAKTPEDLLSKLKDYLPDLKTIDLYITLYLSSFWQYYAPFVDPVELVTDFKRIFAKSEDGVSFEFCITKKPVDYARIALVLTVLRHSAITINQVSTTFTYDKENLLMDYATSFLKLSQYDTYYNLPALQSLMLIRKLRKVDPFQGDSLDNHECLMIFQNAVSLALNMGLHRNIDRLYAKEPETRRNFLKMIWKLMLMEDLVQSYELGVDILIKDDILETPPFSDKENTRDAIFMYLREASVLIHNPRSRCRVGDITEILSKIENYHNGKLIKLAADVKCYSLAVDDLQTLYSIITDFHSRFLTLSTLNILNQVILDGVRDKYDNEFTYTFYNAGFKHGTLCLFLILELLLKINKQLSLNASQPASIFPLAEICLSAIGRSKLIIVEAYFTCLRDELLLLSKSDFKVESSTPKSFTINLEELEKFDPRDKNNVFHTLARTPAFLHGKAATGCQYLMKIQSESFSSVFKMNYFLGMIAGQFRIFDKYFDDQLPADQKGALGNMNVSVGYNSVKKISTDSEISKTALEIQAHEYPSLFLPSTREILLQPSMPFTQAFQNLYQDTSDYLKKALQNNVLMVNSLTDRRQLDDCKPSND